MSGEIKIAYNSAQRRMRMELPPSECVKSPEIPKDMIERARSKLESEIVQGNIDHYELYDNQLAELWAHIRTLSGSEIGKETLDFTLGIGGKKYPGLLLHPSSDDKSLFKITFEANSMEINNWRLEWMLLQINREYQLKVGELRQPYNVSQIQGAWYRAVRGEKIQELPITALNVDNDDKKTMKVVGNKARGEASLVIFEPAAFMSRPAMEGLFQVVGDAVDKLNKSSPNMEYALLKERLTSALKTATHGMEAYGVGLPMSVLFASGTPKKDVAAPVAKGKQQGAGDKLKYKGKGLLELKVSSDKMQAEVAKCDHAAAKELGLDQKWVLREAHRQGVKSGISKKAVQRILNYIQKGQSAAGLILAQGKAGVPGTKPYLHASYKDVKRDEGAEEIDIRENQEKLVVHAGDLVAEVRFEGEWQCAKDITGREYIPDGSEELGVEAGRGVKGGEDGKYYATVAGMPILKGNALSVAPTYVHKGDVNLKTGNISFDGSAEIQGSIEANCLVAVTGNMVVAGTIGQALVRVGGDLIARQGITTGEKGYIRVKGNLTAEFIENSNILVEGNLKVGTACLNSNIIVGGKIEVNQKKGVLAGGVTSVRESLKTFKLGFSQGNQTELKVGIDWRAQMRISIRSHRLEVLDKIRDEDRKKLREAVRKKPGGNKNKDKELAESLQARLQRARDIYERCEARLEEARKALSWNKSAKVYIREVMASGVNIELAGNILEHNMEVAGVLVCFKKRRGTIVVPISEESALDKEDDDDDDDDALAV